MIAIVIPAYNEAERIGRVIRDLFQHGYKDIVVVDDGSSDNTQTNARAEGVVVIRHSINRGQGAALQTGDEYALARGAESVVHFDADGQFSAADIKLALEAMNQSNLDVVLGSRFLDGRTKAPWLKKYLIFPISIWIHYLFTGVKLTDPQNGFRIFKRAALAKLLITHDRMAHNSEIVAEIKKQGLKFKEVPVEVTYHEFGQGIGGGFKILRDLLISPWLR